MAKNGLYPKKKNLEFLIEGVNKQVYEWPSP
jgi:hypothetical protein